MQPAQIVYHMHVLRLHVCSRPCRSAGRWVEADECISCVLLLGLKKAASGGPAGWVYAAIEMSDEGMCGSQGLIDEG